MEPKLFLNHTVSSIVGVKEVKGNKFGVELELEGRNVALHDVATKGWHRHNEPSLRGEAIEYTTTGAKTFEETKKLVDDLFDKFKAHGVKLNDSIRAGTHVHLNFSDQPVKNVINFFALFTLLEEVLQYYSGEDRKGNVFCISTREAEGIVGIIADSIAKGSLDRFAGDRYKYAACNLSSLYKFGTIEIRTMKAATSAAQINSWVDILNDMYEYAINLKSPAALVQELSFLGAEELMKKIFQPKNYRELMKYFPAIQTLHHSLMEGARLIQIFAYGFEEDFIAKVEIKKVDAKEGAVLLLPSKMPNGHNYVVYTPNGRWNVARRPGAIGPHWRDGEACIDDPNLRWNVQLGRFVYTDGNGNRTPCNWMVHNEIPDEGQMPRRLRAGRNPFLHEDDDNEDDEEIIFDEPDEDNEEGDDF